MIIGISIHKDIKFCNRTVVMFPTTSEYKCLYTTL